MAKKKKLEIINEKRVINQNKQYKDEKSKKEPDNATQFKKRK